MTKLTVKCLNGTAEVEGATDQDVWKKAAFWSSLPTTCPVDGTPVVFGFANRGGYDYWYIESTGQKKYRFNYGLSTDEKGALFPGSYDREEKRTIKQWTYWDGEKENVVWEDGKMLATPQPQQTNGTGPDPLEMKRLEFDQLGTKLYGTQWSSVRGHNVDRISAGKTSDYKQLNMEQLDKLIDGLKSLQKKRETA